MRSLVLRSPAKLNLYLKVVNKRPDGYHNLITLFERIDLCDDIQIRLNRTGRIRVFCSHPDVPNGSSNIVFKAAQIFKKNYSVKDGADIKIVKRIPVAAGLGGGSSNAATTLLGLNKLWKLSLNKMILLDYARKLGSDVPFFVENCSFALGTERGDYLKRLSLNVKLCHILVVPKLKVLTREVFGAFRPPMMNLLTNPSDDVNILIRALRKNDLSQAGHFLANDLETTIVRLYPTLSHLKNKIKEFEVPGAIFSGSGPSFFGLANSLSEAKNLKRILNRRYTRVFVVKTL